MVPDTSRTSLGLEYFLWEADEEWTWSDERLIERGVRECARIGIIDPSEVEDGTVVRMKKAYPIYDHAYRENVDILRRYLEGIENLQTVGRNGLHRYNNQDHSMLTAVYAARNIIGEKHDVWAVNTEEEYHEETRKTTGDRATPTRVSVTESATEPTPEELIETAFARIDPVALGSAIGLVSGLGLFSATALLLLRDGPLVGRTLSLLGHFLLGFEASWAGAFIGLVEAGLGGFLLGYGSATARNWGMSAYAHMVRRRAEARERRDLLDRV